MHVERISYMCISRKDVCTYVPFSSYPTLWWQLPVRPCGSSVNASALRFALNKQVNIKRTHMLHEINTYLLRPHAGCIMKCKTPQVFNYLVDKSVAVVGRRHFQCKCSRHFYVPLSERPFQYTTPWGMTAGSKIMFHIKRFVFVRSNCSNQSLSMLMH